MSTVTDFRYPSANGTSSIHAIRVEPDTAPRAIVQVVHGIADHASRYVEFMKFLADHGILCVAEDHLGHGETPTGDEEIGFFAENNGWSIVVSDVEKLHDDTAAAYPGIPYVFFGHSMGSFLTRTFLIEHPDKYDAAILSGTGHQSPALVMSGLTLSSLYTKLKGARAKGETLDKIAFGAYNSKIKEPRTRFDWISSKPESVDAYIADPMCGFVATNSLMRDMMTGVQFITTQKNIDRMDPTKPIYFMSGDADPVGEYGVGVNRAYKAFIKAGIHDIFLRLYPGGRHEMLNESNNQQVYQDILDWIDSRI